MTIYFNDDRDYSPIIEKWVNDFRETLEDDPANGNLRPGDESGDTIPGIKIIFDGYGEDDEGNPDLATESYAVFIHKDSLDIEEFPEHEQTPWALIHRPKEEICIYAWYDVENEEWSINSIYETSECDVSEEEVMQILEFIDNRYFSRKFIPEADLDPNQPDGNAGWPF
jgi:hypothetical protein